MNICCVIFVDLFVFFVVMLVVGMDFCLVWNSIMVVDLEKSMFGLYFGGFLVLDSGGEVVGCVGFCFDFYDLYMLILNKLVILL